MEFYLYQNEQQIGPYSEDQIRSMVVNRQLSVTDPIWREGLAEWSTIAEQLPDTVPAAPAPPAGPGFTLSGMKPTYTGAAVAAQPAASNSMFSKLRLASCLGALAIFFMPWIDIQCSGQSLATQTGIQVTYGDASPSEQIEAMQSMGDASGEDASEGPTFDEEDSLGFSILVSAALLLVIASIILSIIALKGSGGAAEKFASILPCIALGLLLIQMAVGFPAKNKMIEDMKAEMSEAGEKPADDMEQATDEMGKAMADAMMKNMKFELQPGFYMELVALGLPGLLMLLGGGTRRP